MDNGQVKNMGLAMSSNGKIVLLITGILCIVAGILSIIDTRRALDVLQMLGWIAPNIASEIRRNVNIVAVYSCFTILAGVVIMVLSATQKHISMIMCLGILKLIIAIAMLIFYISSGEIIDFEDFLFSSIIPFAGIVLGGGCIIGAIMFDQKFPVELSEQKYVSEPEVTIDEDDARKQEYTLKYPQDLEAEQILEDLLVAKQHQHDLEMKLQQKLEIKLEQSRIWSKRKLCWHCGGEIKFLWTQNCKSCGKHYSECFLCGGDIRMINNAFVCNDCKVDFTSNNFNGRW